MMKPIRIPATSCTHGRLSAPRSEMNFDRVIGLRMLYAVMARKEYANMNAAVVLSPSLNCTTGASRRRISGVDMDGLLGRFNRLSRSHNTPSDGEPVTA